MLGSAGGVTSVIRSGKKSGAGISISIRVSRSCSEKNRCNYYAKSGERSLALQYLASSISESRSQLALEPTHLTSMENHPKLGLNIM